MLDYNSIEYMHNILWRHDVVTKSSVLLCIVTGGCCSVAASVLQT